MEVDLRCSSKKHAILILDKNLIEIKCDSRFCGAQRGVVILHRFDLGTGEMTQTMQFKSPGKERPQ